MKAIPIRELNDEMFDAWTHIDVTASKAVHETPQTPMAVVMYYTLTMERYRDSYQFNLNQE